MRFTCMLRAGFAVACALAATHCSAGTTSTPPASAVAPASASPGPGTTSAATPTPAPSPSPSTTATAAASASGDFLNFSAARGWNYLVTNVQSQYIYGAYASPVPVTTATVTLYDYPTAVDGTTILLEVATPGIAASALTVATSSQYIFGAAGFSTTGTAYTATRYANDTMTAAIPATIVVRSPLVLGATSTPFAGVTQTVTAIGTVPGESACPAPSTIGATVQYAYGTQKGTVSYVPGCGVTQIVDNRGEIWTLQSIGSYPNAAGNYVISAVARQVGNAGILETVRSIFGLEQGGPIRRSFAP